MNDQNARVLLEANPDLMFLLDGQGRYLDWAGRPEDFAIRPDEFMGKTIHDLFPDSWANFHHSKIRKALEQDKVITYTYSLVAEEERFFEARVVPSHLKPGLVVLVARDVTENTVLRQDLEERTRMLEKSNEELAHFAYIASHDLQEPLRTITSFIEVMREESPEEMTEEAIEAMQFITDAASRMKELILGLLDYSRVESRGGTFKPVDMQVLVEKVVGTMPTQEHHITCENLPTVYGDPTQLSQVIQNLVSNSIKYRKPDSAARVSITGEELENTLLIQVEDEGIGIDPDYHEQIFVIFKRLYPQHQYPGTGIGLAIAKKIIERHGGTIWVESEADQGSTFKFTLPKPPA